MRILRITLVTLLLGPLGACLVTARGGAGTVPPPETEAGPSQGIVEGVVVDAATHQGLARVGIDVARDNHPVGSFTTDDSGHYRLPPLAPGVYAIRVRREKYNQVSLSGVNVHPGANEVNVEMNSHP